MNDTMYIEQIKDISTRKMLSDMSKSSILDLKNKNLKVDKEIQSRMAVNATDKCEFDQITDKYNRRQITSSEYTSFNQNYSLRRDSLDLNILSFKMQKSANECRQASYNYLDWFCKFGYGEDTLEIYNSQLGKNVLMPKEGLYNSYFKYIMEQERIRLDQKYHFLCLQLNFCKKPGSNSYEQYVDPQRIARDMEDGRIQLETLKSYESQVGDQPVDFVDFSLLTVEDLMNGDSQQIFDKFFLKRSDEKKRAM